MLFAWADDINVQEYIMEMEEVEGMKNIRHFFRCQSEILFIVDQTNALDPEGGEDNTVSDKTRNKVRKWIHAFAANHKVVYSASANYQTRVRTEQKQTNDWKLYVYGGFSEVSPPNTTL